MNLSDAISQINCKFDLVRDGNFSILEQCTLVRGPGALTYIENEKYLYTLGNKDISCVICRPEMVHQIPQHISGVVVSPNPKLVFFLIQDFRRESRDKIPTHIDPTAQISPLAYIAPHNVIISKNVEIQPYAVIHENTEIQDNVLICSGTVIGGQSFTAVTDDNGGKFLVKDSGRVRIEFGVEICSNCHIACGTLENDTTIIGEYSKLDAMVHVGHGTIIGKRNLIPAAATISGNCIIGDDTWIGVNATISNRISIGDSSRVTLGSVVTKNVPKGQTVTGNFAIEHKKFLRNLKKSLED